MHLSPSCLINDLWTDLVIEPLTGNSNDKFDGRKFNWIGTAMDTRPAYAGTARTLGE
jgi:hypothetical protein